MKLSFAHLDRRLAAAAVIVALLAGGIAVAVEAIVTHHDKSTARSHVRAAAAQGTALVAGLRRAATRRAEGVTQYPQVQGAFANRRAGTLKRFAAAHPNIAFELASGRKLGHVTRNAVVSRLPVVTSSGRAGVVIAGAVPTAAQLAAVQDAAPRVRISYYVDGVRRWPATTSTASEDVTAQIPFLPSVGQSSLRLSATVSEIPARTLWPPLAALLAAIGTALLLSARRPPRAQSFEVAKSLDIVGETLAATHDPQALLPVVLKAATEATGATGGVILTDDVPRVSRGTTNGDREHQLDVPLRTEAGTVSVLRLFSGAEPFDQDARDAARWIATQAEIALENAHLHRLVQQQALTDDLTSLPNRRRFMTEFRREAQRADRAGTPLSVIVLDIDDFKLINDTWGHDTGDQVLRKLAEALTLATRGVDLAARLGGEEFAVLLPSTDAVGAQGVAERIQRDLASMTVLANGAAVRATVSFGISSFPRSASLADLLNDADRCLYEAKRAGKNRIVVSNHTAP